MTDIWFVEPEHIDSVWEETEHLIQRTDDRESNSQDIYKAVKSGQWQLILVIGEKGIQAACTVSFVYYPTGNKMCRIETVAGDNIQEWAYHLQSVEEWAKLNKCVAMDIFGRKGWEKFLKPSNYEFEAVLLRKYF